MSGPDIDAKLFLQGEKITLLTLAEQGPKGANGNNGDPGPPGDIGMDPGDIMLYFENALV